MIKYCALLVYLLIGTAQAQNAVSQRFEIETDSIKKSLFLKQIGNGYFPTKYFDFDLRYLVKFNQFEGLRTGLGGLTNDKFSKNYRLTGYTVYGFADHAFKYSIGGSTRIFKSTNTWLGVSYTDDLQETGSSKFLTDTRFFQFFEPRLLNIDLFHRHITQAVFLKHQLHPKLASTVQFAVSNVEPTYSYQFNLNGERFSKFQFTTAITSFHWSPFNKFKNVKDLPQEVKLGYPQFAFQFTKSIKDAFKGDFNFTKIDLKAIERIEHKNKSVSEITVVAGIARGDTPLTHLYHAYPNNINKEGVFQRFSVAGITSFETMFFNEFFSDKFTTLQFKHYLKPFRIAPRFQPQLVLISRYALGDINSPQRHENIAFGSLKKGYTESGLELNKLLFGFGLSFTYRYGAYHLPNFDDNLALKFTFNVTL